MENRVTRDYRNALVNVRYPMKRTQEQHTCLGSTEVVNVKAPYIRPQYNNIREWIGDSNNAYVGRKVRLFITEPNGSKTIYFTPQSVFRNPYPIKYVKKAYPHLNDVQARDGSIQLYRNYMVERLTKDPELVKQLCALKGKRLGCWCKPDPCHADVLLELINRFCKVSWM